VTSVLWLLCIVAAVVSIRILYGRRADRRQTWWRLACALPLLATVGVVALFPPWILLQKTIGLLLMPGGLLACALALISWQARTVPKLRWLCLATLCSYTIAANTHFSRALNEWLAAEYRGTDPLASGPFDAVFVLGGGTDLTPDGRPQLGRAGDRLALGAALYHQGATKTLVCSGGGIEGLTRKRDLTEETLVLWQGMGVPPEAVVRIPEPRNTREEVAAYATLIRSRGWKRVGLVTSARHMRRAMGQCRRSGIDMQPLPADIHGSRVPLSLPLLVPKADAFLETKSALWEIVGALAGY
jgi:uncharacterized SAM-binding protein YcdF (DUF218 family)